LTAIRLRAAPVPLSDRAAVGTRVPFRLTAVTLRADGADSPSATVKVTGGSACPSITVMSAIGEMVGGVLICADAVTVKVRTIVLFAACPSFTVTVIVAVPAPVAVRASAPLAPGDV
jgi:hypothetical protein